MHQRDKRLLRCKFCSTAEKASPSVEAGRGALLFPFHWPRMYYADFSNRIYSKNEKEIKGYIQSIHNIVLDNEKGRTVDENLGGFYL